MFEWATTLEGWTALVTLAALEIVLGIDNIIFISILTDRLPPEKRPLARKLGLSAAMFSRIALLLAISWVMRLTQPLFTIGGHGITGKDIILVGGGLFLLAKATREIHQSLEGNDKEEVRPRKVSFGMVLLQVAVLDIVFSLDSVITAVGLVEHVSIMVIAIVLAVLIMMFFTEIVSAFIERHPTIKMLALSFLILVGMTLILEGFGIHVPKGYIYFAMGFSISVEMLNIRLRKKQPQSAKIRRPEG